MGEIYRPGEEDLPQSGEMRDDLSALDTVQRMNRGISELYSSTETTETTAHRLHDEVSEILQAHLDRETADRVMGRIDFFAAETARHTRRETIGEGFGLLGQMGVSLEQQGSWLTGILEHTRKQEEDIPPIKPQKPKE